MSVYRKATGKYPSLDEFEDIFYTRLFSGCTVFGYSGIGDLPHSSTGTLVSVDPGHGKSRSGMSIVEIENKTI